MGRPRKFKKGEGDVLTFRASDELIRRIFTETLAESADQGRSVPRSEMLNALLDEALTARDAKRKRRK